MGTNNKKSVGDFSEEKIENESSTSETSEGETQDESEEEPEFDTKNQNQFLETLLKLKRKDPSIYDQQAKFYSSEESPSEQESSGDSQDSDDEQPQKPMLLKDLHAEMILEGGEKVLEEKEKVFEKQRPGTTNLLYNEEQRQNLQQFQDIVNQQFQDSDLDDDLLNFFEVKPAKIDAPRVNNNHEKFDNYKQKSEQILQTKEEEEQQDDEKQKQIELLKEVFNEEDGKERFLKNYLLKERWKGFQDDDSEGVEGLEGEENQVEDVDLWKDEEYMDQADYFEKSYNARFEEEGKTKLISYPRDAPGSIREKKSRRKRQREAKAVRLEEHEQQQERELKRQKNIKTKEIKQMVDQIQQEAGGKVDTDKIMNALLSGGDLTEFYKNLDDAFGEEYYNAQDDEYGDDQPIEDGALHDDENQNEGDEGGGVDDEDIDMEYDNNHVDDYGYDMDYDEHTEQVDVEKLKEQLADKVDEYHNLDYEEQTTDGVKWRFNYVQVPKEHFGLTPDDILNLSDKDLNQIVGIGRLAPYKNQKIRPNYKKLQQLTQRSHAGHASGAWKPDPLIKKKKNYGQQTNNMGVTKKQKKGKFQNKLEGVKEKKLEQQEKQEQEKEEEQEIADPVKQRMSSFQAPKLPTKLQIKKDKKDKLAQKMKQQQLLLQQQQQQQNDTQTNNLTKSQKRNLRRSKKRQENQLKG